MGTAPMGEPARAGEGISAKASAPERRCWEKRWRPDGFAGMEWMVGRCARQDYPRHWHEEIYLGATLGGISQSECPGKTLRAGCGQLALIAPGEIHSNWKAECHFRCVLIELRALQHHVETYIEQRVPGLNFRSGMVDDRRTIERYLQVHRSMEEIADPGRDEQASAFFRELARRSGGAALAELRQGNEDAAVNKTKRTLEQRYAEALTLSELAQAAGLSPYHLNRSFRRKVGMPPHEYQLQIRILRAKDLLRAGRAICETAALVGFVDQSHLTRHFKRAVGVTPGQFQR